MIIIYAAGVGQEALDSGSGGNNGLFTSEFVAELRNPHQEVSKMVQNVRKRVKLAASKVKHEQTPAIYIQADEVYLITGGEQEPPNKIESDYWNTIKDSNDPEDYKR